MKPTKNHVYCPQSGKAKIQFGSEREATLFLQYNANSIKEENGIAPTRTYFCNTCKCWHVTSKEPYCYATKSEQSTLRNNREYNKVAKATVRLSLKEIKKMLHEVNRFITNEKATKDTIIHYYYIFRRAQELFGTVVNDISKAQYLNIQRRIYIIQPYFA